MQPGMFVVEDDASIRETLRMLLEDAGYQVRETGDGNTALAMLREMTESQVVLLDQCLPGLTGGAVLQAVASDASLRSRHAFVLLTASTSERARQITRRVPQLDVAVVSKPFDVDDLLDTITAAKVRLTGIAAMAPGEQSHPSL